MMWPVPDDKFLVLSGCFALLKVTQAIWEAWVGVKPLDLVSRNPCLGPYCTRVFIAWGLTHHVMFCCRLSPFCRDPGSVWLPCVDTVVGICFGLTGVRLSSAAWAVFHLIVWSASLSFRPGPAGSTNFNPCHFPDVDCVFICPWC